jgi:hypothetical protein
MTILNRLRYHKETLLVTLVEEEKNKIELSCGFLKNDLLSFLVQPIPECVKFLDVHVFPCF